MKKVFLVCSFLFMIDLCYAQSSLRIIVPIGHTQPITSLAISPDDKFILSGGADNMVHLWSADAGRLLKTYRGHSGSISTLLFSHSGKFFLSLDNTGSGFVREVMSGITLDSVFVNEAKQLYASSEQDGFCWIGKEGELHTWRPGQSKIVAPQNRFFKVALSPNGKYLIAMGESKAKEFYGYWGGTDFMAPVDVYLINLSTGVSKFLRKAKISNGNQLGFTPDGSLALVGDQGNAVFAYAPSTQQLMVTAKQGIWLDHFDISSNGLVKLNCYDGQRLWNPAKNSVTPFKASDNSLFGKYSEGLQELGAVLQASELDSLHDVNYWLSAEAVALEWKSGLYSLPVRAWVNSDRDQLERLERKSKFAYWKDRNAKEPLLINAMVATKFHTKNRIASSASKTIIITDLESSTIVKELLGLSVNAPSELSFSPDNQLLAFRDKSIRLWNFSQSKLVTIDSDSSAVFRLLNPPQLPKMILVGTNGKIEFRHAETGNLIYTLVSKDDKPFAQVKNIEVSPDQKFLLWKDDTPQTFTKKINWNNLDWYSYEAKTDSLWIYYQAVIKGSKEYTSFSLGDTPPMEHFFFPNQPDLYSVMDIKYDSWNRVYFYRQTLNDKLKGNPISKNNGYNSSNGSFSFNTIKKVSWSSTGDFAIAITNDMGWGRINHELFWIDFTKEKSTDDWYDAKQKHIGFWPLTAALHPHQPWFAATNEYSNDIRTFQLAEESELKPFSGHNDGVTSLAFSSDGKLLASGSTDNTIKIWNAETRQELATLVTLTQQDWVVLHPSGLFDATPGAMNFLYFSSGSETIGLEQLKDRFYEPNLLKKIMSGEILRTVSGLDRIDLYPAIRTTLDTLNARLTIHLVDQGGGIGKTSVSINGKEAVEDVRSLITNASAQSKGTMTITVDLSKFKTLVWGKDNYIGVKAFNASGYISSPAERIYYQAPLKEQHLQAYEPSLYCLVVGVSDYANDELDLKYSSKDAQDFAAAISTAGNRLFGKHATVTLLSSDATDPALKPNKENINHQLKEISEKAKVDDLVILYFSGHGTNQSGDDADFLYLTADARGFTFTDPAIRQSTTLSSTELTEFMKTIAAQKFVLIFDACASGRMVENMLAKRDVPTSTLRAMERMKDRTGTYILSGCAADAVSYEASQFGQGLLTYSLLSGMKGAALRENKFVDVLKLFQYAKEEVPRLAENVGGIQEPKVFSPYGGESFDIGLLNDDDRKLIPLTEAKPFFVRSSFQNEVKMRDDLGLSKLIDQSLGEQALLGKGSSLIFIDAQEFPGAFNVYGRYKVENGSTTLHVVIYKNEVQVSSFDKTLSTTDPTQLVSEILKAISSAVKQKE